MNPDCYSCQKGVTEPHRCPITLRELMAAIGDDDHQEAP